MWTSLAVVQSKVAQVLEVQLRYLNFICVFLFNLTSYYFAKFQIKYFTFFLNFTRFI